MDIDFIVDDEYSIRNYYLSTQRNNIKIQEIYLDLIKAKGKKINFKTREIKKVYEILSENKTDEIYF